MNGTADEFMTYFGGNAESITDTDKIFFLLSFYRHLELECDAETDRLERLAQSITVRTQTTRNVDQTSEDVKPPTLEHYIDPIERILVGYAQKNTELPRLRVRQRAQIAQKYRVPHHIFGCSSTIRGGRDLELIALESCESRICNLLAQLDDLEAEIAAAEPQTPTAVIEKLRFLAERSIEGSPLALDVFGFVVAQCVQKLEQII